MPSEQWLANRKQVRVYLTLQEYEALQLAARKADRPIAYYVRAAVLSALKKDQGCQGGTPIHKPF